MEQECDKALNIALDYDETFTAHRELWTNFVYLAKGCKCKVTFVTYRYDNGLNTDILRYTCSIYRR